MLAGTSRKYLLYPANRCFNVSLSTRCSTKQDPDRPYVAKFPDKFGNLRCHKIPRSAVISTYFEKSNFIDSLNHMHQHELGLEKKWIVKVAEYSPWFRIDTTVIGMSLVDTMKGVSYMVESNHPDDKDSYRGRHQCHP